LLKKFLSNIVLLFKAYKIFFLKLISGGNFHGEYPAKVLDYLAIGVHELANISERRIERLVNCKKNI
jgi:histidine ammonia-lyase